MRWAGDRIENETLSRQSDDLRDLEEPIPECENSPRGAKVTILLSHLFLECTYLSLDTFLSHSSGWKPGDTNDPCWPFTKPLLWTATVQWRLSWWLGLSDDDEDIIRVTPSILRVWTGVYFCLAFQKVKVSRTDQRVVCSKVRALLHISS